jgi:hypothetical protein
MQLICFRSMQRVNIKRTRISADPLEILSSLRTSGLHVSAYTGKFFRHTRKWSRHSGTQVMKSSYSPNGVSSQPPEARFLSKIRVWIYIKVAMCRKRYLQRLKSSDDANNKVPLKYPNIHNENINDANIRNYLYNYNLYNLK